MKKDKKRSTKRLEQLKRTSKTNCLGRCFKRRRKFTLTVLMGQKMVQPLGLLKKVVRRMHHQLEMRIRRICPR